MNLLSLQGYPLHNALLAEFPAILVSYIGVESGGSYKVAGYS